MKADQSNVRYQLLPVAGGGFKIARCVLDHDFDPPLLAHAGYLNRGRRFHSREAARDYMRSGVER